MKVVIIVLVSVFLFSTLHSQDCDCLLSEVENNIVVSCDYTVGTIVSVSSASEFRDAIIQANNSGGNMTILIADGTYQVSSTAWYPYITGNNIVIRSESGNRDAVVLTGHGMADVSPNTEIGIYAVGDDITIADLTIRDVGNHGIAVTGDNVFVYNVRIQDTYEQMIKGNSKEDGIKNGVVKCSLFEYTDEVGPQWYIGGLDIHSGINWTVSDNIFRNIASPSQQVAEHAIHFWDSSVGNLVERNKIVNCDRGIGFGLGNSPNDGGIIKNNMITNDGSHTFNDVGIGLESSPNTQVYNNSIHISHFNSIEYRFSSTTDVKIINNLTNKPIKARDGGEASLKTNVSEVSTSWYEDVTTGNLRLSGNITELVDRGTSLENVTLDIDQNERPQASAYDIGASEYLRFVSNDEYQRNKIHFSVFPIPAHDKITIVSDVDAMIEMTVYNSAGLIVNEMRNISIKGGLKIDVSAWSPGVYYCSIHCKEKELNTMKLFIVR